MDKQIILGRLSDHAEEIRQLFAVKELCVFGSVARGEATEASDVDILVTFRQKASFDVFMNLKFYLEDLLNMGVDLVTNKALRPQIRRVIESEAIHVA